MACIIWLYPVKPTINNFILLKKLLTQKMKPLRMLLHLNLSARKESVEPSVLSMKKNGNIGIIDCVIFSSLKRTINARVVDSLPLQYHRLRMDQNVCTACELAKVKKKNHTPGTRTK